MDKYNEFIVFIAELVDKAESAEDFDKVNEILATSIKIIEKMIWDAEAKAAMEAYYEDN